MKVTKRLDNLTLFFYFVDCEPVNFQEAVQEEKLRTAMNDEIVIIIKNDTWELTSLQPGHKLRPRCKMNVQNQETAISKRSKSTKARLVAKCYCQKASIDCVYFFAHVARLEAIRPIISLAAKKSGRFVKCMRSLRFRIKYLTGKSTLTNQWATC